MERAFESAVSATPPTAPASPAIGYPRKGDPGTGTAPTKPGPWWYHMVTEEIRAVIVAGGLTPDQNNVTQMRDALIAMYGAGRPGHVFTANDWCPLPGGLILQWGVGTTGVSGAVLSFPIAFNTVFTAVPVTRVGAYMTAVEALSVSGLTVTARYWSTSNSTAGIDVGYIAVGK